MKIGRNDQCTCGSGKKFKHCCIDAVTKHQEHVSSAIGQAIAMNPDLTIDEIEVLVDHKTKEQNNRGIDDFKGLTPDQMHNWLYKPFNELSNINIAKPSDVSASPVMRYLALMLDEAFKQEGKFKATARGNMPAKLIKQASELLPNFAVAKYETESSISEFSGSREDRFNALHYARVLADVAGIVSTKRGQFCVTKSTLKQYQVGGINAFFLPMLEAALTQYNWAYFDTISESVDVQRFWVFMLWRIQSHGNIDTLIDEVAVAFPDLLHEFSSEKYSSPKDKLGQLVEVRFIIRFLQFWGFVTVNPRRVDKHGRIPARADLQPLFKQTFQFTV